MDSYTLQGQMNSLLSMWPQHSLTHKSCGPFLSCRPYIYDGSFTKATKSSSLRACGNSSNGSAFAPLPNSDSDSNKNHNKGTFNRQARPGQNVQKTPDEATQKGKTSPVSKQIIESNIEKSRGSLEGIQQQQQDHIEQGQDGSLISYEGTTHKDSGVAKSSKNAGDQKEVSTSVSESDSFWRSVFPAYMRSKEEEEHLSVPGDESSHENAKGLGVRGAAAARAAAAAAASAKELESHVNLQTASTLSSSSLSSSTYDRPIKGKKLEELMSDDPIWAAIRAEARLEAEREPLLSSFLYASILAHPCFERSLGFVLANRLKDTTLLATQLMDVFDDVFMKDVSIRQAVRLDVQAVKDRDPSCRSYSSALLYLKGYHALQSYRVANALWNRGQKVLALALQSRISEVFAVDIHPAARIGKAILMDHGTGVVIGETAVVGDRVSMLQGVTLGGTGKIAGDRHPKIGEGVLIGAGATILGNITVGRGAMVAAGSLVLKDVPPHSMVAGTPARVVGVLEEPTPSLTMKHDFTKDVWASIGDDSVCGGTGI